MKMNSSICCSRFRLYCTTFPLLLKTNGTKRAEVVFTIRRMLFISCCQQKQKERSMIRLQILLLRSYWQVVCRHNNENE